MFCVPCEDGNSKTVSILSMLHILNFFRDIFNKVVIFISAHFSIYRYVSHSKKCHWSCVMCICVCMKNLYGPGDLGIY